MKMYDFRLKFHWCLFPRAQLTIFQHSVQIMAWCRRGYKPLSEPITVSLLTHICVARPQWVNVLFGSLPPTSRLHLNHTDVEMRTHWGKYPTKTYLNLYTQLKKVFWLMTLCRHSVINFFSYVFFKTWASCQIRKIASCACAGNAGNVFPATAVRDPDMHHGTCVTHVPRTCRDACRDR